MSDAGTTHDGSPPFLRVEDVQKRFGREQVLAGSSLAVPFGKTLSVLGRSGSGKTTLLKIIAGLESADAGRVLVDGQDLASLPPHERQVVYLYQEALLFPHLNVRENVAFGLRLRRFGESDIRERVGRMLERLDLGPQAGKSPDQLSGGQRQRVAFGRALIIEPRVLLLDEPFGALDVETRADMQQLYLRLAATRQITAVFVTHDLKEALILSEQLAVMDRGRLNHYSTRAEFVADAGTGVQKELAFWKALGT